MYLYLTWVFIFSENFYFYSLHILTYICTFYSHRHTSVAVHSTKTHGVAVYGAEVHGCIGVAIHRAKSRRSTSDLEQSTWLSVVKTLTVALNS